MYLIYTYTPIYLHIPATLKYYISIYQKHKINRNFGSVSARLAIGLLALTILYCNTFAGLDGKAYCWHVPAMLHTQRVISYTHQTVDSDIIFIVNTHQAQER